MHRTILMSNTNVARAPAFDIQQRKIILLLHKNRIMSKVMRNKQPLSTTTNNAIVIQTPHPFYAPRSFIYNRYSGGGRKGSR
jgi:hypothetical protein